MLIILLVILSGEANVGKTTLCRKYLKGYDTGLVGPTLGIEYHLKNLTFEENGVTYKVKVMIWDTAGQERYKAVTGVQLRNAHGALVVYDITHRPSFDKVSSLLQDLPDLTGTDTVNIFILTC